MEKKKCIYAIVYTTTNFGNGIALAIANSPNEAFSVLCLEGRFNGTPDEYVLLSTEVVGLSTLRSPMLIGEKMTGYQVIYGPKGDKGDVGLTPAERTNLLNAAESALNAAELCEEKATQASQAVAQLNTVLAQTKTAINNANTAAINANTAAEEARASFVDAFKSELVLNEETQQVEGTTAQVVAVHTAIALYHKMPLIKCSSGNTYFTTSVHLDGSNIELSFEHMGNLYKVLINAAELISTSVLDVSSKINEAPIDSKQYVRKDGSWQEVSVLSAQVQSDWSQTDSTAKDYIRNKPTIPTTDGLETSQHASATYATKTEVNAKQDTINDLQTIREGAALGATALQEHQSLADYETSEHASQTYQAKGNYLTDAPNDGKQYARKDGSWAEVQGGGGAGIPETEVVTINVKKSDGTAFGGAQIAVIVNGNTTQTLTADGNGVATTTISGGSSYTIAPVEVDNYVANQQIYTACKETRTIEVVYNLVTTELVNVYVRYATEASNAPTLNATQRVILTYIESGTSEEYMLDSSNNVSFRVQRGVLYSIGVTDLSGYTTPKTRVFTASKARRDVRMYYTNMDDGIYLVKADGTQVLTDAETDYSTYEDKENVVAIGFKTAALKAVECCFCISTASDANVRWNSDNSVTTGLVKYMKSSEAITKDMDGQANTEIVKNAHSSCTFNYISDNTLEVNGETYNAFVPALGQFDVLLKNWSRFNKVFADIFGVTKNDINNASHNSSSAHSTVSNCWYYQGSIQSYTGGTRSKSQSIRCIPFFPFY